MDKSITIVTAFFDIGRGKITNNYPKFLKRSNETYFKYFSYLATLENNLIVFTSKEFEEVIYQIRGTKPTQVITFDLSIFNHYLNTIKTIQNSAEFKQKIPEHLAQNIEYWHPSYVLVTNLKTFFVNLAIRKKLIQTNLISWIDFGYVREPKTLNKVKNWQYPFDHSKIHLFTIEKDFQIKEKADIYNAIFNNQVYTIGGAIVGSRKAWLQFYKQVRKIQKSLLNENIVDDDQGIFLMALYQKPTQFELHFLGKNNWFGLFKKYDITRQNSVIRKLLNYFYRGT